LENRIFYRAFTLSKLIALLAVVFLLSATLDKVPDCPELLNSSRGQVVSLQLAHAGDLTAASGVSYLICFSTGQLVIQTRDFVRVLAVAPSAYVSWPGYQASDPSPPSLA
jgi:hypothetical protein